MLEPFRRLPDPDNSKKRLRCLGRLRAACRCAVIQLTPHAAHGENFPTLAPAFPRRAVMRRCREYPGDTVARHRAAAAAAPSRGARQAR